MNFISDSMDTVTYTLCYVFPYGGEKYGCDCINHIEEAPETQYDHNELSVTCSYRNLLIEIGINTWKHAEFCCSLKKNKQTLVEQR